MLHKSCYTYNAAVPVKDEKPEVIDQTFESILNVSGAWYSTSKMSKVYKRELEKGDTYYYGVKITPPKLPI